MLTGLWALWATREWCSPRRNSVRHRVMWRGTVHHQDQGFEQLTQGQAHSKKQGCWDQGEEENFEKSVRQHILFFGKHAVLTFLLLNFASGYASKTREKKRLKDVELEREKEQYIQELQDLDQQREQVDLERARAGKVTGLILTTDTISSIGYLSTLWFQIQDTVLLFGTVLLLDPVHFRKYPACLLIGSILNFEALLGAPLIKTT